MLALLGHLAHSLTHEGDKHVQQEHEGEDDVGDQQENEDHRVLGAAQHLQVAHANGKLEEIQEEGAEGLTVAARGVRGHRTVALVLITDLHVGAWIQEGDQGCRRGRRPRCATPPDGDEGYTPASGQLAGSQASKAYTDF